MSDAHRFVEALQPRVMGPRLAVATGGGSSTCHVLDAKYEPGVNAVILYSHAGRLYRGDLVPSADWPEAAGADAAPVVDPGVRISAFPHDPQLPGLVQLMDPAALEHVLAAGRNGQGQPGARRRSPRCRVQLLRYRPGKRATVLVTSGTHAAPVVVKAYHKPAKAAAVAEEAPALAAAAAGRPTLRLAAMVSHVPELALVVHQVARGTPLDVLVGNGRGDLRGAADGVRLAATALAELHSTSVVSDRRRSVDRELARFGTRAARVGSVDLRLGRAAAVLAERLVSVHAELPAARTGLVHGDCKPSQFLLSGRQAHLLDLDHLGVSDQAADVGTFLASLRQLRVRHALAGRPAGTAEGLGALAALFLEAYLHEQDDDGMRTRVRWQEAVALERKALRAFARAPRSPLAGALLKEANRCLDELTGTAT